MPPAEQRIRIRKLEEQTEKLEAEISRSAGFYQDSRPTRFSDIRSAVPDRAALIEIAVYRPFDPAAEDSKAYGKPRYVAYVIRNRGKAQWKELGVAKPIDNAVDALRQALRDPQRKDVRKLARVVDEKIMQPLRGVIGDASHLLLSPDGQLNLIPFEALIDEQGHFLIERYSATYLTSGRDLLRPQTAVHEKNSKPLIIANPSFGEKSTGQVLSAGTGKSVTVTRELSETYFAPLRGTAREAESIQTFFPKAIVLTEAQATESALKQVDAPEVLHIATHGFFLTNNSATSENNATDTRSIRANVKIENPLLRSGLAFAGANLSKTGNDDGILTALEASGLSLWGTKLVTLSACDTGVGEVKNGEGVYGLRRAFVLAGAESIVMSLWPVSDYLTLELMTGYYSGLKQGLGRREALRQVQIKTLQRKGREHPFFWAGFIQSGEWANLDGKR
jgi:CHAT domain-containing protein